MTGWLFASPWILGFLLFTVGPMLFSMYTSFTRYNMLSTPKWIGAANYIKAFQDRFFIISLENTGWMVLVQVPLTIGLALLVAVLLERGLPGSGMFRTIVFLPTVLGGVASIFLWRWILAPNGLLNSGLAELGIGGPSWFSNASWTKPGLVIMSLWFIGVNVIIFLAGLRGIDTTLYDAAEIDGAGPLARVWHITLPLLSPTTFFLTITSVIGVFQIFTTAFIITSTSDTVGGPKHSMLFYVLYLYKRAFGQDVGPGGFEMGYAAALAWILFIIILLITALQLLLARRWVHYESS